MKFNTRTAPSPTGFMHLGTARTAYYNWLIARSSGGKFLLRIDDTDNARNNDACLDDIYLCMQWLGLDNDMSFKQSSRIGRYNDMLSKIPHVIADNGAILLDSKGVVFRKIWHDNICGDVSISDKDISLIDKMVLIKSDGTPSYNWASVVDDFDYNINYIVRGVDHISNTQKQIVLFDLIGGGMPQFAHVGLLTRNGKPLSKRDGDFGMSKYINMGYDVDAMLNFIVRLGVGSIKRRQKLKTSQ